MCACTLAHVHACDAARCSATCVHACVCVRAHTSWRASSSMLRQTFKLSVGARNVPDSLASQRPDRYLEQLVRPCSQPKPQAKRSELLSTQRPCARQQQGYFKRRGGCEKTMGAVLRPGDGILSGLWPFVTGQADRSERKSRKIGNSAVTSTHTAAASRSCSSSGGSASRYLSKLTSPPWTCENGERAVFRKAVRA